MGCKPSPDGVTLDFLKQDGLGTTPSRDSVTGKYCAFFSHSRPESHGQDIPSLGSQDWLTHVIVTDDPGKLAKLLPAEATEAETSCSSKRVRVLWWVGNDSGEQVDSVTLSGCPKPNPNQPPTQPRVFEVKQMTVMPGDTDPLTLPKFLKERWLSGAANLPADPI
jgi:hypothetical protein